MKTCLRYLITALVMLTGSLHSLAVENADVDTVYFYNSWEQMIDMRPIEMLIDPYIEATTPFNVTIYSDDEQVSQRLAKTGFIAVSVGLDVWLLNSQYIEKNFKGDVSSFSGLVPVFFNDKVAYLVNQAAPSFSQILYGATPEDVTDIDYYCIDFANNRVDKVTHHFLSDLLTDYHDLLMRYEGMKNYKKREIIEDYFLKWVDRASSDVMRPYILEQLDDAQSIQ